MQEFSVLCGGEESRPESRISLPAMPTAGKQAYGR
jgi:hypothetical protein